MLSDRPLNPHNLGTSTPKLLTSKVAGHFFRRFLIEHRPIRSLTIVSPWISDWEDGEVSLKRVLEVISLRNIRTSVITRPPIEAYHERAVERLKKTNPVTIYFIPDLHAKVFVCNCVPVGFGLVGSANLTARSFVNYEVGILFEARGALSPLLPELQLFAQDLRRLATEIFPPIRR